MCGEFATFPPPPHSGIPILGCLSWAFPLSPSDDLPKPQIIAQPQTTVVVLGSDVRLTCKAASSSSSPVTFAWRKDQELLGDAETENLAHVRARRPGPSEAPGTGGGVMEYTTILHLRHVTFAHEGRYQCVITNHFGSTYSSKARLIVNGGFPASSKTRCPRQQSWSLAASGCSARSPSVLCQDAQRQHHQDGAHGQAGMRRRGPPGAADRLAERRWHQFPRRQGAADARHAR